MHSDRVWREDDTNVGLVSSYPLKFRQSMTAIIEIQSAKFIFVISFEHVEKMDYWLTYHSI